MNIFSPKYSQFESFIERGKYLMAYRLTLIFTLVFLVMTCIFVNQDLFAFLGYLGAFLISAGALTYLLVAKKYKFLFLLFGIGGTLLAHFAINFSLETPHYVDFLWMIVASFLAFTGLGKKWGLAILIVNALGSFYFIFFSHNRHFAAMKPFTTEAASIAYVEIVLAFFAIGYLMYQFIVFQNYSETKLQKANSNLNSQNALILAKSNDNETLIKEIHHRVKNNLQIIISLLRLQRSENQSKDTKEQFTEAINRVMVMSSIHQRLYQEKEVARINLKSYLTDLAADLQTIFEIDKSVAVIVETTYSDIDLKTVVPLGLLLNELISNSYKYAFKMKSSGEIKIQIIDKSNEFELHYSDNGKWLEKQNANSGFGLDLITILAEQLNGTYGFETDENGTRYHFSLSKLG